MNIPFNDIHIVDIDDKHMLGRVHSFVAGSVVDGPGLRYVVFLQGCQMQCLYCHNRDSWDRDTGSLYSVNEVIEKVLVYSRFIDASHGGITVTGGEPLLQPQFVGQLFEKCRSLNFHTCLDTNGLVAPQIYGPVLDRVLQNTNLVMLDIKQMDAAKHLQLTGVDNAWPLRFAQHLKSIDQPMRIRYVVVPGYNDSKQDLIQLGEFLHAMPNLEKLELLPYHRLGVDKWLELGLTYPLADIKPPSEADMQEIKSLFQTDYNLRVLL